MNDAYQFRPFEDAKSFLTEDEHHTPACKRARKKAASNLTCFCDLPAHVKQIQDEAMTAASLLVIEWMHEQMVGFTERYAHPLSPDGRVAAVEATALQGIVENAKVRFRS